MKPLNRWKFSIALVAIILVVFFGLEIWSSYFSQAGRQSRELQANYQKYLNVQNKYEAAMKADTYGGKTPEETLGMFIDALKKGDIELASKYFVLREDGLNDPKWLNALIEKRGEDDLNRVINITSLAVRDKESSSMSNIAWFVVLDEKKELIADIELSLNTYSQIWKIESL